MTINSVMHIYTNCTSCMHVVTAMTYLIVWLVIFVRIYFLRFFANREQFMKIDITKFFFTDKELMIFQTSATSNS